MKSLALTCLCLLAAPFSASGAELILNEYNGVAPGVYLNGGTAFVDDDGVAVADATLVRVLGNGGDWTELVVVADHPDIRGYNPVNRPGEDWWIELRSSGVEATGTYISVDSSTVSQTNSQITIRDAGGLPVFGPAARASCRGWA